MNESPLDILKKAHLQASYGHVASFGDNHASPLTHSQHEVRPTRTNYIMHQAGSRKIFGYEIFVDNEILRELPQEAEWFEKVKSGGNVESIKYNLDLNIPDLNGRNIQIFDKQMERKYQSSRILLADIYQVFKRIRREPFSIIIFVPEGMVSLLIGTKGYQINKIMRQSHTTIVVNQPINRMTYRTVKIQGYHSDIAKACRIIYQILQDKSSIAYSIQKEPSQLDYTKARVKTKFILCSTLLNYLLTKKKSFIKKLEDQTKCIIKFKQDTSSRLLKRDEELCVLLGKLEDVQAFLVTLVNLIHLYYDEDRKNHDYTFKMLIPSNYVTKLIGQKGYMIRDIIQRSGGAQIKILSDRQSQRDARECIISINGTRENKIDATCLILEQIQCFKNGGPILQSGKSINQNLAQQFKNSLPLHKCQEFNEESENTIKQTTSQRPKEILHPQIEAKDNSVMEDQGLLELEEGQEAHLEVQPPKEHSEAQKVPSGLQVQVEPPRTQQVNVSLPLHNSEEKKSIYHSPQRKSSGSDSSLSRSRKKSHHNTEQKGERSSPSSEYQQDKQFVQVKLVVPRKLAQDHKQLKYIQSLGHSEIIIRGQRVQGSGQAIISVRGSLKDNSQCIKMLQKRIMRLAAHSSTVR